MKNNPVPKKQTAIKVPRFPTTALISTSNVLTKAAHQPTKKLIMPRKRKIIIESSQEDNSEEEEEATEEQVVPQLPRFTGFDLDIMLTNINNSVTRRGLRVSLDGRRIEAWNEGFETQQVLESSNLVGAPILPVSPFLNSDYIDIVDLKIDNDKDVISMVKKCATFFCEAYKYQDQIEDLKARIALMRDKQVKVWVDCKKLIMEQYPHDFLHAEDKELFFNTALLGKDFIPQLIQARALQQLIKYESQSTKDASSDQLTGFYGISRCELLRNHGLSDNVDLLDQASARFKELLVGLKKIYKFALAWIVKVEECLKARTKYIEENEADIEEISTQAAGAADELDNVNFEDCEGINSQMSLTSDTLDFPSFNKPLTMYRLSMEDKDKCKLYLEHPQSHGCLYPPEEIFRLQVAFFMDAGITKRASGVKRNKKFGAAAEVGNGIFNGPRILPASTELLFMGVIFHGKYDRVAMGDVHAQTWDCEPDEFFADRILQIKKDSIYILGYHHLFTSFFNEEATLGKNNIRILSNPSIGLLRVEREVNPYTELTVSYGDSLLCELPAVEMDSGRSSKRARESTKRYEPEGSAKSRKERHKKQMSSQEVDGADMTQESVHDGEEDSDSSATDILMDRYRHAADFFGKNPAKIVDLIKSMSKDELKEHGLQVQVIGSTKYAVEVKDDKSVSSLAHEDEDESDEEHSPTLFKLKLIDATVLCPHTPATESMIVQDAKERLVDSGLAFFSIECSIDSINEFLFNGLEDELLSEFEIEDATDFQGLIKACHKDVFDNTDCLHTLPMEKVFKFNKNRSPNVISQLSGHFRESILSYLSSIEWDFDVYEDLVHIYHQGSKGVLHRCYVSGMSTMDDDKKIPQSLACYVIISDCATVYSYPSSHHLNRAASSNSHLRSIRQAKRFAPALLHSPVPFAVIMQPDLFRLIDNCGGPQNECSNMMIFQYFLQADKKSDAKDRSFSYTSIHPTGQWVPNSQKAFLRTNYKYLHEPRYLTAYDREDSSKSHLVMRGDYDQSWTKCIENIKAGKWTLPYHGVKINADNVDAFLVQYANEQSHDPDHVRLVLEILTNVPPGPEDPWPKIFDFEVHADRQEVLDDEDEESTVQASL